MPSSPKYVGHCYLTADGGKGEHYVASASIPCDIGSSITCSSRKSAKDAWEILTARVNARGGMLEEGKSWSWMGEDDG